MVNDLVFSEEEISLIKTHMDLIPDDVFDIHNHIYLKWNIQKEIQNLFFYSDFSFDDLLESRKFLYPGKHVESLIFWQPQKDNQSIKNNNEYVKSCPENKFLLLPNDNIYIERELATGMWKWAKAYWFNEKWILNNVSNETLTILDEKNMPLLIHLPCNIIEDQRELCSLLKRYKNVMFIVAHWWNVQKCKRNYELYIQALKSLKNFDNVWFDTSCINDEKYLKLLVENFDKEKIFYWSDLPISLIKGIALPGKNWAARIISDKFIRWVDNKLSKIIIKNLNLDLSNIVNIQQTTISALWKILSSDDLEKIFYRNAKHLNVFS